MFIMESQQNNISSQTMLSAIVGMMFLAPVINNNIKNNSDFSQEEKEFISWYIKVWYINLLFLIIVLVSTLLSMFYVYPILSWIITIGSLCVFIITTVSLFACISSINMRKSDEKIITDIQHKGQILKTYIPFYNFVLWFRQENYNMPYRWLKESILLRTIFIFWTLLLWNYVWIGILLVILVRILLLMMNVDIIPLSIKKAINSLFSCNPWEIIAYLFSIIISKFKNAEYETILQSRKLSYTQWQSFWIGIIIQYLAFIAILYFIHRNNIDISWIQIIILIATILWIFRVIIFYKYKKTFLKIPILSEIISLVFH